VEKSSGTLYWTGVGSEAISESTLSGTINEEYVFFNGMRASKIDWPSDTVHAFLFDHLGSSRMSLVASGTNTLTVEEDLDYTPYGIVAYGTASDPFQFDGKEHDSESGLNNFGARYDAATLGRFMTPDWATKPTTVPYAKFGDPQTLNLYAFVENGPVNRADMDGHLWNIPGQPGSPGCVNTDTSGCSTATQAYTAYADAVETTISNAQATQATQQAAQNQSQYDPKKSGPEDPTNPGHPLSQNSVVKKASDQAFMTTGNGNARSGLAEAGFSIEYKDGKISIANKVDSVNSDKKANGLSITTDADTIAILHTHGNKALPTPSEGDRNPSAQVPDFVRSQRSLYVTVPGSAHGNPSLNDYIQLQ
jgi:RHS repeat-associated protein